MSNQISYGLGPSTKAPTLTMYCTDPVRPAHLPYIHLPAWPSFLKPDRILVSMSAMLCFP